MTKLSDRVKLSLLNNGDGMVDNFKNNSLFFFDLYKKSIPEFLMVNTKDIQIGGFYFLHYQDKSNWMKWSPVFIADYKKFNNKIIIFAINFNFIPLEIRVMLFDKFISDQDFDNNSLLSVNFRGVYDELRSLGFEYALMEFDALRVVYSHKVSLDLLPRFLYHQHPGNVYDPNKLMEIWQAKLAKRDQRHKEMMMSLISDFYDMSSDINEKYDVLKKHIQRIRSNYK